MWGRGFRCCTGGLFLVREDRALRAGLWPCLGRSSCHPFTFLPSFKTIFVRVQSLHSVVLVSALQQNECHVPCWALSRSRVRLCATAWTVVPQAPLCVGFLRQEYWSVLPCPPPGIFPTQGLNPGLPHCRQILYQLSYEGSPNQPYLYTYPLIFAFPH